MSEHPKFLILTTNRTEDGEPVYAPCGDVRELVALWRKQVNGIFNNETSDPIGDELVYADVKKACADALEAALKPQGDLLVARPLQIGVEYQKEEVKL